jgi:HD superfamily phosphohydrolase
MVKKMKKKIIRDAVYNYIEVEENVIDIIDSESFQRLKHIKQLTIQHLYPSANHTRFEHSLGVMHLALQFFERIKEQLLQDQMGDINKYKNADFLKDHLLYASLLHDVGHAPLSHVGERFYAKKAILSEIENEIKSAKYNFSVDFLRRNKDIAAHEIMSCYVIIRKFRDKLKLWYFQKNDENSAIDLEFIFRIICGAKYNSDEEADPDVLFIKNTIVSILNSRTVDVDKIDYTYRDNRMVGYIGPRLDINRLIMSASVDKNNGLVFTSMGLPALQGLIDCRDILYLWVFNHHTVVYTDYLYHKCFVQFTKLHKPDSNDAFIPISSLFSCKAIADDCASDVDALSAINKAHNFLRNQDDQCFEYTKILVTRFMNREYLKPLWKTLNQYDNFLTKLGYKKEQMKNDLTAFINDWRSRMQFIHDITEASKIKRINLFIIKRENKFYENIVKEIMIKIDDNTTKSIEGMLPIKEHEKKYPKTAFYVYCLKEDLGLVEKNIEDLKDHLSDKLTVIKMRDDKQLPLF